MVEARGEKSARIYPYQIVCTACDARLVAVEHDWVALIGPRPIEVVGGLDGEPHIACYRCGTMVPVDRDLLLLR